MPDEPSTQVRAPAASPSRILPGGFYAGPVEFPAAMSLPFAINGLGRIGRALVRIAEHRPELELVAVNDLLEPSALARLLRRDSVHGAFSGEVVAADGALEINGRRVTAHCVAQPARIDWSASGARVVVEASGRATADRLAAEHLGGSVDKVVVSAIAEQADVTLCLGINQAEYVPRVHHVVSNASCTTNCLALLLQVLDQSFGVASALISEVHSYTADQRLVDGGHPDPRRGRAAAINIVPTRTAAPAAVERLLPRLAGRLAGHAVRVPTPNVALLDVVARLERPPRTSDIAEAFRTAAENDLQGFLAVSDEELVSSDLVGESHSAVVDLPLLSRAGGDLYRVMAWYDNEWGYAARLADLLTIMGRKL
nr:glyceraldehyde-3-phosphate dehydrogenase-like [Nerophis lumbriciformis]